MASFDIVTDYEFTFPISRNYKIDLIKVNEVLKGFFANDQIFRNASHHIPKIELVEIKELTACLSWNRRKKLSEMTGSDYETGWDYNTICSQLIYRQGKWSLKIGTHELEEGEWTKERIEQELAAVFYRFVE